MPSSCYTVNLSLGTPGEYRKTSADPLRYQGDLQIRQHPVTKPEFEDKMTFSALSRTKSVDNTGRLPPVLESDEHHEAVFTPVSILGHSHGLVIQPLEVPVQHQATMGHKKICRSKSHRPRTQTLNDKTTFKEKNHKPPLRKYNSFPYHMFMNEGGYSSDDSIKSAFQDEK